ncbi:hypothetical protein AADZ91_01990 [Colwelliaceae bacterium 6441]
MVELKKHAFLLIILTILIVVKFVFVPVFQWQDDKILNIKMLNKKHEKIENILLNQEEGNESYHALKDNVAQGESVFFAFQKESDFKLSQQKLVETLLQKHNVRALNIGWQVTSALPEYNAINYQLRVQFNGEHLDVFNFIFSLESNPKRISIHDFNLNINGQIDDKLGNINGWLIINFYSEDASTSGIEQKAGES